MTAWMMAGGLSCLVLSCFIHVASTAVSSLQTNSHGNSCSGRNITVITSLMNQYNAEKQCTQMNGGTLFIQRSSGVDLTSELNDCHFVYNSNMYWINGKNRSECRVLKKVSGVLRTALHPCHVNLHSICEKITGCRLIDDPNADISYPNGRNFGSTALYNCHAGYTFNNMQEKKLTCDRHGEWPNGVKCRQVDCGNPPLVSLTSHNGAGPFHFNDTVNYTCTVGYTIKNPTIRCLQDETWSRPIPVCTKNPIIDCGHLSDITHGSVHTTSTVYSPIATYTCDTGYTRLGIQYRMCQVNGSWSGKAPVCSPVDCNLPPNVTNGSVQVNNTTYLGVAMYRCEPGYTLSGDVDRTCQVNGTWSGNEPGCNPVDCNPLPNITDGSVKADNTTYLGVAKYSCEHGYMLSGDENRTCQANGSWSGKEPDCNLVDCDSPLNITHGAVQVDNTTFLGVATYNCDHGYELTMNASRTCQANGNWSGKQPGCIRVNCNSLPNITHGSMHVDNTTYLGIATYNCGPGYTLSVNATRTCQANGNWSGKEPGCILVNCNSLTNITHGSVHVDNTTYLGVATYNCEPGYTLTGDTSKTCQANGFWSGTSPVCKRAVPDIPVLPGVSSNSSSNGWIKSHQREFLIVMEKKNYSEAMKHCRKIGADLVRFQNPLQYLFLSLMLNLTHSSFWVGDSLGSTKGDRACILLYREDDTPTLSRGPCNQEIFSICSRAADIEEILNDPKFVEILDSMTIDKKNTSRNIRRLKSSEDNRPSAVAMGEVGIAMIVLGISLIVVCDLQRVIKHFKDSPTCRKRSEKRKMFSRKRRWRMVEPLNTAVRSQVDVQTNELHI